MSLARLFPPVLAAVLLVPSLTHADRSGIYDRAKVVSVNPTYETISYSVPVEQCRMVDVPINRSDNRYRSVTGPIVGAIIGGAIGNAVGHRKTNKKVGTVVGAVLGGSIGRDISNRRRQAASYDEYPSSYRTEQRCETAYETVEEQQLTGYSVRYRYAGEILNTHMPTDPGQYVRVRVQVTPV